MATSGQRCAACYNTMTCQDGAFTAECGHVFYPRCAFGVPACPSCYATWRATPTFTPRPLVYSPLQPQPGRMPLPFHGAPSRSTCAVCKVTVGCAFAGATFTSECEHTFHLSCVMGSVCPVYKTRWPYQVSSHPTFHHYAPPPGPALFPPVSNPGLLGPPWALSHY